MQQDLAQRLLNAAADNQWHGNKQQRMLANLLREASEALDQRG